jgi:hypothetical protein
MTFWEILVLAAVALILIILSVGMLFLVRLIISLPQLFREFAYEFISYRGRFSGYDEGPYRRRFSGDMDDERIYYIIQRAEEESGVRLTPGARQMLSIPIYEVLIAGRSIDWEQVNSSVRKIVRSTIDEAQPRDERSIGERVRNSIAVIAAFYRDFCNIPPFCAPGDSTTERR